MGRSSPHHCFLINLQPPTDHHNLCPFWLTGKHSIICLEDLIHEIYSVGKNFRAAKNFLLPFKLSVARHAARDKAGLMKDLGNPGFRGADINSIIRQLNWGGGRMCRLWTLKCFCQTHDISWRCNGCQWFMLSFSLVGPGLLEEQPDKKNGFSLQLAASWSLSFCTASIFFIALSHVKKKKNLVSVIKWVFKKGYKYFKHWWCVKHFYGSYHCWN